MKYFFYLYQEDSSSHFVVYRPPTFAEQLVIDYLPTHYFFEVYSYKSNCIV